LQYPIVAKSKKCLFLLVNWNPVFGQPSLLRLKINDNYEKNRLRFVFGYSDPFIDKL